MDIDISMLPEPGGIFGAITRLQRELHISIELVAPGQFVPALPGWQGRSEYIGRFGPVDVYHYDFYSQALAKIDRNHAQDPGDVQAMVREGKVSFHTLIDLCAQVDQATIDKYTNLNWEDLGQQVRRRAEGAAHGD